MSLTKEEYVQGIHEIVKDARNPNGDLALIKKDFQMLYDDVAEHDAEMATHLAEINTAIDRFVDFATTRVES